MDKNDLTRYGDFVDA
ncbi:hypothetical protein OG803_35575 [Streptomyces sp. NBC_00467]